MVRSRLPLVLVCFAPLASVTSATPTIALPLSAQIPPVAQVGQAFEFIFSPSTFSSSSSIRYALSKAPSWLKVDSDARRLFGQPEKTDIGSHQFTLNATDSTGSVASTVTLVVSSTEGPRIGNGFQQQLAKLGIFQSPQTLLFYPESPVNLHFSLDAFQGTNANTHFYAIGDDNTPLPSWLQFDESNLTFRGRTPTFTSRTELPQDIDITLVASDIPGFSQARASFRITVESHEVLFTGGEYTIDVQPGEQVTYNEVAQTLQIDGKAMPLSDISTVSADQPSWLQLDKSKLSFSGTAPNNVESFNFTLTVADNIGDTGSTTITISAPGNGSTLNLIMGSIGPVNVTIGSFFRYSLGRQTFASDNVSVSLDAGNASSWLHFDNASLLLSGTVPGDSRPQTAVINLMASEGGKSQSQAINLNLVTADQGQPATSTISIAPTSTATNGILPPGSTPAASVSEPDSSNLGVVLPAVLCPILGLLLIALLLYCLKRLKGRKREEQRCDRYSDLDTVQSTKSTPGIFGIFGILGQASIKRRSKNLGPLLPAPTTMQEKSPSHSRRANMTGMNRPITRQAPIRLPRPPSGAPQITRAILERDPAPDPLEHFRIEHQLVDEPRPESIMLPAPPPAALLRTASQSEPQRQSYKRHSRASMSSLLNRAANGRLSAVLHTAWHRNSDRSDTDISDSRARRPRSQPQSGYSSFLDSLEGTNRYDFQAQHPSDSSGRAARGSEGFTTSGDWTTTSDGLMDPSSSSSGNPNRNTSSTINGFLAQASPRRRNNRQHDSNRFANTTVRGVTPSVSSFSTSNPGSPSKRGGRRPISMLGRSRSSHSSMDRKLHSGSSAIRGPSTSPSKNRRSWGSNNHYGDFLKTRRQMPATIRFSNSGMWRKSLSNYHRTSSMFDLSSSGSSNNLLSSAPRSSSDDADKENARAGLSFASPSSALASGDRSLDRKRSRGSVQKLGRQMQMADQLSPLHTQGRNMPFSRKASTRSFMSGTSTSASEISFRVIEEEVMAEVQDNARYWKSTRQGSQRRSSRHRLSALSESQGQGASAGEMFKLYEGKAAPVQTTPQEELPASRSFKGEFGEWRQTDDEGSVATRRMDNERAGLFLASSDADSESGAKAFI